MSTERIFKPTNYFTQSQRTQFIGSDFFAVCFSGQQFHHRPELQGKLSYNQMNWRNTGFNRGKLLFLLQDFWETFIHFCAVWHSQKGWEEATLPKHIWPLSSLSAQYLTGDFCTHFSKYCSVGAVSFHLFWFQTSVPIFNSDIPFSASRHFISRSSRNKGGGNEKIVVKCITQHP